jgi:uncharacterized membrane protein (DUF373 family)
MPDSQLDTHSNPARQNTPTHQQQTTSEPEHRFSLVSGDVLDRADGIIYAVVGACFLIGAICALGYSFWDFGTTITTAIGAGKGDPALLAKAIIQFVSDLLLVLIIMEVLGTVTHYLKSHATSLRPFLFIGIVSATRSILSIGARLSVEGSAVSSQEFTHAMIELGVSAAVILALGITLTLLSRMASHGGLSE